MTMIGTAGGESPKYFLMAICVIACATGCSRRDRTTSRSALTLSSNAEILGFENPARWDVQQPGVKASSTQHSEGTVSLSITTDAAIIVAESDPLTSTGPELSAIEKETAFRIDVFLPVDPGANRRSCPGGTDNDKGCPTMEMVVDSPARNLKRVSLGTVNLDNLTRGRFQTAEFKIPDPVATALTGGPYSDLRIKITLRVAQVGGAVYLLDNLRVRAKDGDPRNLHPTLNCVVERGSGQFDALFGYFNDSSTQILLAVGPQNRFTPDPEGRGQSIRFFPARVDAAFAVLFDGSEIVWNLPGGSVAASAQSPRCTRTTCPATCFRGEQCIGGACVTECGDGFCAGDEGCASCPADCACATGLACFRNACGHPARCGIDWQCGSGESFGTSVTCPGCPAGQSCVDHICR